MKCEKRKWQGFEWQERWQTQRACFGFPKVTNSRISDYFIQTL